MIGRFFRLLGRALDPKRDFNEAAPRPFLLAKNAVEYLFRIIGFFILLCLTVVLTLLSCSPDPFVQLLPVVLTVSFFFYIAITTLGIPVFMIIGELETVWLRRLIGYTTVLAILFATIYSLLGSPIYDLLFAYVEELFPATLECTDQIIDLSPEDPSELEEED